MKGRPTKEWLENLYVRQHRLENLHPDPLVFARGFADPRDGEVAGLVAASFAYGRVEKIMQALERIWTVLGPAPRHSIENLSPAAVNGLMVGFTYRFHKTEDVALFFHLLQQALEKKGSLESLFRAGDVGGDIGKGLCALSEEILGGDARPVLRTRKVPSGHPVRFLLACPSSGGAAKRLCLFLRWMVRRDEIDPGYWAGGVDPARLVVPLDTHVARVGRVLGFTERRASDWRTAEEITQALRQYDDRDPVRYDFSLFRYGMDMEDS